MTRRAPLIVAVVVVLLAILAFVFLVMPKLGEIDEAEQRLDESVATEDRLQAELSRLQEAAEDAPQLRRELARFRRAVPPVADLPGLINQVDNAATVAGVDFFSIAPGVPTPAAGEQATEIATQVQVIGGFFPVREFLFRLETLPRASKAVGITVAAGPDGLPQIDVRLDLRFYTTDVEAGPGAPPVTAPGTQTGPTESPSPGASPTETPDATDATPGG